MMSQEKKPPKLRIIGPEDEDRRTESPQEKRKPRLPANERVEDLADGEAAAAAEVEKARDD